MKKSIQTVGVLVASILLIIVGLLQNQNQMILQKAIKICLECVGIG